MQLLLVAHSRGKMRLKSVELTTGDVTPPRFAQPPLVDSAETSLRLRVSSSEPATLHWAISYDNVAAEYRYQLLGFKTSKLSTQQVLQVSNVSAAAESARLIDPTSGVLALRRLQQDTAGNETLLQEAGPIVAWGQWRLDSANQVVDLDITPPCISDTVMCMEHTDSLNPQTEYKVCVCRLLEGVVRHAVASSPGASAKPDVEGVNVISCPRGCSCCEAWSSEVCGVACVCMPTQKSCKATQKPVREPHSQVTLCAKRCHWQTLRKPPVVHLRPGSLHAGSGHAIWHAL